MPVKIEQPYPVFRDKIGFPLDGGLIYVGVAGLNPETNPIQCYFDEDFTLVAPQPLRTINGYISRNGSPSNIFLKVAECSITIKDRFRITQYTDLNFQLSNFGALTTSQIIDDSGLTQQQINNGVDSVQQLRLLNATREGDRAYLKSYILGNKKGGGNFQSVLKGSMIDDGIVIFNSLNPLYVWVRTNFDSLTPEMAGAKGDGVINDYAPIQKLIEFVFKNKLPISCESSQYGVGQTLLIPRLFDSTFANDRFVDLDFNGTNFVMLADTTLFSSGYYNSSDVLVSSFGQPFESQNTSHTILQNFTISSAIGYPESTAITLQDWHQNCFLQNISTRIFKTFMESRQCFYTKFLNINASYSGGGGNTKAGTRFKFTGDHNLCTFEHLVAVNSDIGYDFNGGTTACYFNENSIEGMNKGIVFNGAIYDFKISNCYIEGIVDTAVFVAADSYSLRISNNYINYDSMPSMFFLGYNPSALNNVYIESSNKFINMSGDAKIIKNREDSYGRGIVIEYYPAQGGSINDFIVDNTVFGANINIIKPLQFQGYKANTVNGLIYGNYSGRFTTGLEVLNGATWTNLSSTTLQLNTKIINSQTQRIYVNLAIDNGVTTTIIAGEFIGRFASSDFYKFTGSGLQLSSDLNISIVGGFVQINGTMANAITKVTGEVRLI